MLLQGDYHRSAGKLLVLHEFVESRLGWVGQFVLPRRARDRVSRAEMTSVWRNLGTEVWLAVGRF